MPAFFTSAHIRLSLLLSILGALIALIFTLSSDSGVTALIFRPLVSALLMFILGSIIYALFAKQVPEVIDVIENRHEEIPSDLPDGSFTPGEGEMAFSDEGEGTSAEDGQSSSNNYDADYNSGSSGAASNIPRKTGVQIGKEEIVVNGVKFKNQPEVMAETIKQLMEQDKD